ncbi:histidine utilization repressor [Mesorhizobium sp. NBSH29]|nr:histidine utilization repressor [Mesorhizobium sp. NBSH29]
MHSAVDGGETLSLHQRILCEIRDRILSGEWEPGYRIPFEHELTDQYGCSRMTVNKALSQLAATGLIERRRRSGSFVRRPQLQSAILEIHDIKAEVAALALPYRYELSASIRRKATQADRLLLDVASGHTVLALSCRHFAGAKPFCLEERLISLDAVPEAAEQSFTDMAPGPWLVAKVPWSAAEHTIRATSADTACAEQLGVARGTACLVVERKTWSAEQQAITHVRLTYAGDDHALVARFTPAEG